MIRFMIAFVAVLSLASLGFSALMVDRALRGYQDSPDRLYLSVAGAAALIAIAFAALAVSLLRGTKRV